MASATDLGRQVEALFLSYVDAGRREVEAAMARMQDGASKPARKGAAASSKRSASTPRRSRESMAELVERIVAVVQKQPGCSMQDIARDLATTSQCLNAPMAIVRKSGRVRSVGARSQMRYFPAISRSDGRK